MVFSFYETIGGLNHLWLGLERRLLRRSAAHFVEQFMIAGTSCRSIISDDGEPAPCPRCGFALVQIELPGGYCLEACSATSVASLLKAPRFSGWVSSLAQAKAAEPARADGRLEGDCAADYDPTAADRLASQAGEAEALPSSLKWPGPSI